MDFFQLTSSGEFTSSSERAKGSIRNASGEPPLKGASVRPELTCGSVLHGNSKKANEFILGMNCDCVFVMNNH